MLLRSAIAASAVLLCSVLASPGYAKTLFVSGTGTGSGSCTASAPCIDIQNALAIAVAGDKIVCQSRPAGTAFSLALTIDKSITIDCRGADSFVGDTTVTSSDFVQASVYIDLPSNDRYQTVRLRGLHIDGNQAKGNNVSGRGITIHSAGAVYIEDCIVANVKLQGIYDYRTGGQTKLFIKDTIVSGNGGAGIVAVSAAVGITVLDNVSSEHNTYGIAVGTGNNVMIKNSVFSGNSVAGVEGDNGAHVVVSNSTISHNNIGVQSTSSVRIYNSDISFNNTTFSGLASTMGLNRYSSNVSPGTAPSTIPGAPGDIGP